MGPVHLEFCWRGIMEAKHDRFGTLPTPLATTLNLEHAVYFFDKVLVTSFLRSACHLLSASAISAILVLL